METRHSLQTPLGMRGGGRLRCQRSETKGSSGTIKLFLEAAKFLFLGSSLVGTFRGASLVLLSMRRL